MTDAKVTWAPPVVPAPKPISTSIPAFVNVDGTVRDQYVFEAFYRLHITPYTHLTPDIQVVIDPANAPNKDAVTVFGL